MKTIRMGVALRLILLSPVFARSLFSAGPPSVAGVEPGRSVEIDRIEISGVSVFSNSDVESAMEVSPGDKLERIKVIRSAENLQALYKVRGYEKVSIQSRLVRKKDKNRNPEFLLEFVVSEGKPTRIASIRVVAERLRDSGFEKVWNRLKPTLASRFGLAGGDVLDQEKLSNGKRALQNELASEEFIGAQISDIRTATVDAPTSAVRGAADRWVSLEIHVDLGDRVSFGFRGNEFFTNQRLAQLIDELRLIGFGKDYVGAIRSRIEEEYRSVGFARVSVTPFTLQRSHRQERHVTFVITEGPRVSVSSIDFDGNLSFSNPLLREEFFNRTSGMFKNGIYIEKEVQKTAKLTVDWIQSKGYLNAKLVAINSVFSPKTRTAPEGSSVKLIIYLYEGEQTLVSSVAFTGLSAIPVEEAKGIIGENEGDPLNLYALSEGLDRIKKAYRSMGYLGMKILNEGTEQVVNYSRENQLADIKINISEGPKYRVSRIVIEGLATTREDIVTRELQVQEGDVLEEGKISAIEGALRKLGIFSLVKVNVIDDPENPDRKILKIVLQEGTPGIVGGGVGFRNDLGLRLFGQVDYTNLWGKNHTATLNAAVNRRIEEFRFLEYQTQLGYLWPWFGIDQLMFRPTFTASKKQYINLDASVIGVATTWERRLFRSFNLVAVFTYSLEKINQDHTKNSLDEGPLQIGSITPSLKLDLRDNPLSPASGLYSSASYEIASRFFLSQVDPYPIEFNRFQFRTDYLIPVVPRVTWFWSFRYGHEINRVPVSYLPGSAIPTEPRIQIPLIRQFTLGGAGSLRGFREQELNLQNIAIQGYATYVNYRTQVDLPLAGDLRFGPFLDAGNLQVDAFSFGNLRYGAGFGFHYQTPVGPVNFDWGFKLHPRPGEDPYRFYFSIGVI